MDRAAFLPSRPARPAAPAATRRRPGNNRTATSRRHTAHERRAVSPIEILESRVLLSTYYVSPSGSDAAAGSSSAPWKSLQKAADNAKAGDVVRVGAGTYNAGMNLFGKAGGTATAPIQFLADPGAVITHAATVGTNASLAGINLENAGGYYVIQGFTINSDGSMNRAGIRVANTSHVQLLNNKVDSAYIGIFTSSSTDLLLQGNVCSRSTDQHGIYIGAGTTNSIARGNECYGNNWDGIHMNASNAIGPNNGNLIEGNKLHDNSLSGMDIEGVTNAVLRDNLIYNNTKHGMSFHSQDQTRAGNPTPVCANNTIVNNTITGNGLFALVWQPEDMAGTVVFNNILHSSSTGYYGAIGVSGSASGITSDYNVVIDRFSTSLGTSAMSLASWTASTGQDAHSVVASPSQLFAGSTDFHLKSGAVAIDRGVASIAGRAAPATDYAGDARPQGASHDAGAFEFSSTPDTTPPTISNVASGTPSATAATITWLTNENADTQVQYGLTTDYGSATPLNATPATSHSAALSGLTAGTTYHFRVLSKDAAGNLAISGDFTLTTAAPDTTAPAISAVTTPTVTTTGATINWTTNEAADTQVEFGLTTDYGSATTLNTALSTSHAATLSGLTASTTYHYRVLSKDASGNLAVSDDLTFTTAAPPTTIFSPITGLGDAANYQGLTPSRWSVVTDGGDYRLYLNTSSYSELTGDRLGEYALAGTATYGDFDLSARVRTAENLVTNPMADYALVFGFKDANNYNYVMLNAGATTTQLFAVVNGTRQLVATATAPGIPDTAYHTVALSRRGQAVTVAVDGNTVLSATAASVAAPGRVGVGSFNDSAYFDDINVTTTPPAVLSATFDDTTALHQLVVTFSENVTGAPTPGAYTLVDQATGSVVDPATLTAAYDAASRTLTITPVSGQLPSGDYLLQLTASLIKDADGNPLDGDANGAGGDDFQFAFFHLDGDANKDGIVNFDDMLIVAKNYNSTTADFTQGDFNYDNVVNFDDLLMLAKNYNAVSNSSAAPYKAAAATTTAVPASSAMLTADPVVATAVAAPLTTTATSAAARISTSTPTKNPTAKPAPVARKAHARPVFTNRKITL